MDLVKDFFTKIEVPKVISIIGLAKNVSKTTTLNYIIRNIGEQITLGLTSIGRDGEKYDVITELPKPQINIKKGTYVVTAQQCFEDSQIKFEIIKKTGFNTPLGEILPTSYYNHFFAHPYAKNSKRYRKNIKVRGFDKLIPELDELINDCKELENNVLKNKINIRNLTFVANHIRFYCKKRRNSKFLIKFIPRKENLKIMKIKEIEGVKDDLHSLLDEYKFLWLSCAKNEGFDSIRIHYIWLNKFYNDKIEQLSKNIKWENPNINSELIYLDAKDLHKVHTTFYRKVISIEGNIEKAFLQVIGGTFTKTYVNDSFIGHTITRSSLNYVMLENNIQIFDIKEFLRPGDNKITIENTDFIGGVGPINIYGEIRLTTNESISISTDKTWLGTRELDKNWSSVKSFGKPPKATGSLCYPDFENLIHSKETDSMASLNSIVSRLSKRFFRLSKLTFYLFYRFDILE